MSFSRSWYSFSILSSSTRVFSSAIMEFCFERSYKRFALLCNERNETIKRPKATAKQSRQSMHVWIDTNDSKYKLPVHPVHSLFNRKRPDLYIDRLHCIITGTGLCERPPRVDCSGDRSLSQITCSVQAGNPR